MEESLIYAIEQMKMGDKKGFDTIYFQSYDRVHFKARKIMKNEEDALDLTQLVFVEVYNNIYTLQETYSFYSWLDEITYRQGTKLLRKKRDVLFMESTNVILERLESNDISSMPELTMEQEAANKMLGSIIGKLPELQKTALILYYFENMKVEQIAEYMGCSANTVKSRLNYARKYLRQYIEKKESIRNSI